MARRSHSRKGRRAPRSLDPHQVRWQERPPAMPMAAPLHPGHGLPCHGSHSFGKPSATVKSGINQPSSGNSYASRRAQNSEVGLPKLQMKGGGATCGRSNHQRVAPEDSAAIGSQHLAIHSGAVLASNSDHCQSGHQQWTMLTPAQRFQSIGLPSTGHTLPLQMSLLKQQ